MSDFLTEQLVKQKPTFSTFLKKLALILITITSALFSLQYHPIFLLVTFILIFVDIILFQRMNLEFEYIFFNGELDIDKIMNRQSRKRVFSTDVKKMEVIAPTNSVELRPYQELKKLDYSSNTPENKTYEMVTEYKGQKVRVVFEPNEKILNGMKNIVPRKVFF